MNSQRAERWKQNALFRVLAFLDNTGVQKFDLVEDTAGASGEFAHANITFGDATPMTHILQSMLVALRLNIIRLFTDELEKSALLELFGTQGVEGELAQSAWANDATASHTMTPLAQMEAASLHPTDPPTAPQRQQAVMALPKTTALSEALVRPESLAAMGTLIEHKVPLHLYIRLSDVLGVTTSTTGNASGESPLLEQLLIDAIDRWMTTRSLTDNRQLVLACGVQPVLVDEVCARPLEDATRLLVDFVVDVVFPQPVALSESTPREGRADHDKGDARVLDWLILSYEKNHEFVDVEDEEFAHSSDTEMLTETTKMTTDSGLAGWAPADGEVVLTEDNIDEYMKTHPEWIPAEVMRDKRRPWTNAGITAFELAHHYTVAELKDATREIAKSAEDSALCNILEARLGHSIHPEIVRQARNARKKTECVAVLLSLHASVREENGTDQPRVTSKANHVPQGAPQTSTDDTLSVDVSLSVKELEKRYTLARLKQFITDAFPDEIVPATKQKCAKLIKCCANKSAASS